MHTTLVRVLEIGPLITSGIVSDIVESEYGYNIEGFDSLDKVGMIENIISIICNELFNFTYFKVNTYGAYEIRNKVACKPVYEYLTDKLSDVMTALHGYDIADVNTIMINNALHVHVTYNRSCRL